MVEGDLSIVVDAALGSLALSLLLLIATAIIRVAGRNRAELDRALTEHWTPVFLGVSTERWPKPLSRRDERAVLALWNRVRAAMRGPATQPLVARARQAGLDEVAVRLLKSRRPDDRLNAVAAVGTLGIASSLPTLERFARGGSSITLRSESARSMLRIDGDRGLAVILELLREQPDWHPALIASVLDEAYPFGASTGVADAAAAAAARGDADTAARLLRVLPAIESAACLAKVRTLLASTDEPDVQAGCLLVIGHFADAADRATVRRYLASDVWYVRVHAVSALGSIGCPEDESALTELLGDPEWWVRQRAAEALGRIAGLAPDEMAVVFDHHPEVGRFSGRAYSPVAEVRP